MFRIDIELVLVCMSLAKKSDIRDMPSEKRKYLLASFTNAIHTANLSVIWRHLNNFPGLCGVVRSCCVCTASYFEFELR